MKTENKYFNEMSVDELNKEIDWLQGHITGLRKYIGFEASGNIKLFEEKIKVLQAEVKTRMPLKNPCTICGNPIFDADNKGNGVCVFCRTQILFSDIIQKIEDIKNELR